MVSARRCILNKADQVDRQRLMRVYGALMWSLGKVVKSPEVLRVYIGSFWDQPLMYEDNGEFECKFLKFCIFYKYWQYDLFLTYLCTAQLFEMEEKDLMRDLKDLPRNRFVCATNKCNLSACGLNLKISGYFNLLCFALLCFALLNAVLFERSTSL